MGESEQISGINLRVSDISCFVSLHHKVGEEQRQIIAYLNLI